MNIGVLGTGMVGVTIGKKLVSLGHQVMMGSRTRTSPKATHWAEAAGQGASHGTFADAAAFGEIVFNCTHGAHALDALKAARARNLAGKVLVDVSNPLDFSNGMPPTLLVCNDDSLGEQIQREFPDAHVVKTLNTMNAQVMVDPARVPGEHTVFVSGDHAESKRQVTSILTEWFGHRHVIDLGDITTSRGVESWLPLWVRLWKALGTADFNLHVVQAPR